MNFWETNFGSEFRGRFVRKIFKDRFLKSELFSEFLGDCVLASGSGRILWSLIYYANFPYFLSSLCLWIVDLNSLRWMFKHFNIGILSMFVNIFWTYGDYKEIRYSMFSKPKSIGFKREGVKLKDEILD